LIFAISPWYEIVTSSTKSEVHAYNISQRRQRRTEPWPQATCMKNWVKLGRVTDRQTDEQTTYLSLYFQPIQAGSNSERSTVSTCTLCLKEGHWRCTL